MREEEGCGGVGMMMEEERMREEDGEKKDCN